MKGKKGGATVMSGQYYFSPILFYLKVLSELFPGGPIVKILPSNVRGAGSISGWGAKIPHASRPKKQNIKQQQYWNKFNQDFQKWPTSKKSFKNNKNIIKYCCVLLSNNYYFIFLP